MHRYSQGYWHAKGQNDKTRIPRWSLSPYNHMGAQIIMCICETEINDNKQKIKAFFGYMQIYNAADKPK